MKTLVLCRHAKSDWEQDVPDFDRPLNSRGKKDAPKMGELLAQTGFQPDLILSSPANRAQTTAQIIGKALAYPHAIRLDERIYESSHGTVLGVIQETESTVENLMVFGHNPTFEHLAAFLMQSRGGVTLPTCGMICFEAFVHSWRELGAHPAQLKWFLIPKIIGSA